jgi:uncharacterized protein DUF5947
MTTTASARTFAALREFARARPPGERCDLCGAPLGPTHDHLLDPEIRRLQCACLACARLLGQTAEPRWRRVHHRVQRLADFRLSDDEWRALGLPVDLAFLVRRGGLARVVALYPSPGGPVEASVALPAWEALLAANPGLAELRPDVEALLVNRTGARRDHYLISIDECYRLVGLLRRHWRGLSGGAEVQERVAQFFADLAAAASHA